MARSQKGDKPAFSKGDYVGFMAWQKRAEEILAAAVANPQGAKTGAPRSSDYQTFMERYNRNEAKKLEPPPTPRPPGPSSVTQ